jgi:uncharacterized protein YcaQ
LAELSSYFENSEKRQVEETDSNNLLCLIQQTSNTGPIKSERMESTQRSSRAWKWSPGDFTIAADAKIQGVKS